MQNLTESYEKRLYATVYDPNTVGHINGCGTRPHDHGLIRASKANYKPNSRAIGDPEKTLLVGRLNPKTTEDTIRSVFTKYGNIRNIRLVRDLATGVSRRYAFLEYNSKRDLEKAFQKTNRLVIDDYCILVDKEYERSLPGWVPRRLGGGFGGKKESGQLRFGCRDKPWRKPLPSRSPVTRGKRSTVHEF